MLSESNKTRVTFEVWDEDDGFHRGGIQIIGCVELKKNTKYYCEYRVRIVPSMVSIQIGL